VLVVVLVLDTQSAGHCAHRFRLAEWPT